MDWALDTIFDPGTFAVNTKITIIPNIRAASLGRRYLICFLPIRNKNKQIEIIKETQLALEYVARKAPNINKKKE